MPVTASRDKRAYAAIIRFLALAAVSISIAPLAIAAQIDIHGPPGSGLFGWHVAVLQNGNIVISDPSFTPPGGPRQVGAVYLYSPDAVLISALTGSSENDSVGEGRIVVLSNGNLVVSTPEWHNGAAAGAGAATWINGVTGLSGVVSADNSLVGSTASDGVGGYNGVVALTNGNYVVASTSWSSTANAHVGAVTWANGATGIAGPVSEENSLVGTLPGDWVGEEPSYLSGVVALPNGNYVVTSAFWHYGNVANPGAVTLGDGSGGTVGPVTAGNSLIGTTQCFSDVIGFSHQVAVLANGNFVVPSPCWSLASLSQAGAVTWIDGVRGLTGEVSVHNSLVGTVPNERIGSFGLSALSNGNYVVLSPAWGNGKGAATWVDGKKGRSGHVSAGNSLVGGATGDYVGSGATALNNGNYVVRSPYWSGTSAANVGAATWANGKAGLVGRVSATNSLIGSSAGDFVSFGGVSALSNGNYVVSSPYWNNGGTAEAGAATWLDGSGPMSGWVSSANSLVGSSNGDHVGTSVTALTNGNYVVVSRNNIASRAVAATWGDGAAGAVGTVDVSNSLVGTYSDDFPISLAIVPLANGNYVVTNYRWTDGNIANAGAVTWADGKRGAAGIVSASNSLVGTAAYQYVGIDVFGLSDANYLVAGSTGQGGYSVGTLTLADGHTGLTGHVQPWNTLFANVSYIYPNPPGAYDAKRKRIIVGRPHENIVTLFSVTDEIFAAGFEPPALP